MRSIRFRLVGLSVLIFGVTIIALAVVLYQGIRRTQQAAFDTALHNYTVDIASGFDLTYLGDLVLRREALLEENKVFPFPLGQALVQVRGMEGELLLTSRRFRRPFPISRAAVERAVREGTAFETLRLGGQEYRLIDYLVQRPSIPPLLLQVAVPLTALEKERGRILPLIWLLIPLALGAAAVVGLITATRALAPVYRIIDSARAIKPGDLSARVPVPEETELNQLALTLNDLLERLQMAFESQEQFIADASHQLKTPLAIIRGELDVFRKTPRTPEETAGLLLSLSQEVNQLAKMVDDLLLLARFDSGAPVPAFTVVRFDEILLEAVAQLDKRARDGGVEIAFNMQSLDDSGQASDFEAPGDADLLRGLFFNLIENAIKYSPHGRRVDVELTGSAEAIRVEVSDQGPGIEAEELDRVFDRFYRGSRRQHQIAGVGLGLSIAKRIAKFHGAELAVRSQVGEGTTFSFEIPKRIS